MLLAVDDKWQPVGGKDGVYEGIRKFVAGMGSGLIYKRLRGRYACRHIGQHPLDALKFADRSTELLTLLNVGECQFVGALGKAERYRGGTDALCVVGVHQIGKSFVEPSWRADKRIRANYHI